MKVSGIIRYSCAFLFAVFSFSYLYFMQGDLLTEAQFVYSRGLTSYSIPVGAIIITFVLQIVQWVVVRLLRFSWLYYSFSYFPSLFALALITNITPADLRNFQMGYWIWLLPLILIVYLVLVYIQKDRTPVSDSIPKLLWRNYLILFLLILLCGAIPRTHEVHHYEYATERQIIKQDYAAALRIAPQSLHATRRLTELRMYALSQQGLLAECLFDYPQYYGGAGLLCVSDSDSIYRYPPLNICVRLGAIPDGVHVKNTYQYLWAINAVDSLRTPVTQDYFLCYLLLQKRLKSFSRHLQRFYQPAKEAHLPRAYREAVVYINNV